MKELPQSKPIPQIDSPTTAPINGSSELYQRRWFGVGLYPSGQTFKQDAETPAPLVDLAKQTLVTWVDYMTDNPQKDLSQVAAQMGFNESMITSISSEATLNYQDFDTEMWMRLPCIQIRGADVSVYPLFILIRKNIVFTIHVSLVDKRFIRLRRYSDTILKKIPLMGELEDKLTVLMTRIIDANNDSNARHLGIIEERGDDLNASLMDSRTDRSKIGPKIYEMKHALIIYMDALWETVDVLHTVRYGDAELITNNEKLLAMINLMIDEVKSQIGLAEHMSDVLASGLEVMQSIYNNQLQILNNRFSLVITYLTIIGTAVLVPNTLATILGDPVWEIGPKDLWWYLILMVVSTAAATYGMWWWLKRRGWLPKKPE